MNGPMAPCAYCNGSQSRPNPAGGWLRCTKCLPQGVTLARTDGVAPCEAPSMTAEDRVDLIAVADYLEFDGSMDMKDVYRRVRVLRRIAGVPGTLKENGRG